MIELLQQRVRVITDQALRDIETAATRQELAVVRKVAFAQLGELFRLIWQLNDKAKKK